MSTTLVQRLRDPRFTYAADAGCREAADRIESLEADLAALRKHRGHFARDGGKRSVQDAESMPLLDVVAEVPTDKLDWAMQQVQASQEKLARQQAV